MNQRRPYRLFRIACVALLSASGACHHAADLHRPSELDEIRLRLDAAGNVTLFAGTDTVAFGSVEGDWKTRNTRLADYFEALRQTTSHGRIPVGFRRTLAVEGVGLVPFRNVRELVYAAERVSMIGSFKFVLLDEIGAEPCFLRVGNAPEGWAVSVNLRASPSGERGVWQLEAGDDWRASSVKFHVPLLAGERQAIGEILDAAATRVDQLRQWSAQSCVRLSTEKEVPFAVWITILRLATARCHPIDV